MKKYDNVPGGVTTDRAITQFSTMNALLGRIYNGAFAVEEVEAAGTIGLGCGDYMDGEMIMTDSTCHIARITDALTRMDPKEQAPFAQVAPFKPQGHAHLQGTTKADLTELLLKAVGSENYFIAMTITGTFSNMHLRLAPPAPKDGDQPSLVELFSKQEEFQPKNVKGTVVGFWAPDAYQGVTVTGLHVHFMDENKTVGGHILDFAVDDAELAYEVYGNFSLRLPVSPAFKKAELNHDGDDAHAAINHVEG